MADSPYTQLRQLQYRGPSNSGDYNDRIEENYKDLAVLVNRARLNEENLREAYDRLLKEHLGLTKLLQGLEQRCLTLEGNLNRAVFFTDDQVDNDRFNTTPFAISTVDRCSGDASHGVLTLPKVSTSSLSKLAFINTDGQSSLPSTLESKVLGVEGTADNVGAIIDTSPPEFAVVQSTGRIWQRNVVVNAANPAGAQLALYMRVPTDLFTTDKSNCLVFHPYPAMSTDVIEVATTSKVDLALSDNDTYVPINATSMHASDSDAVGWSPPGGWVGDTIVNSGPKIFYFDPKLVTGIRIKLRQRNYFTEGANFIYSYGASKMDLRFDKFLSTGKAMIRFDAPAGHTISNVTSIQPQIWNVAEAEIPSVFTARTIWETSFGSGIYTTNPVSLSTRVWVEATLKMTAGAGTPCLSGLKLQYT